MATAFATALQATVTDQYGNPVGGASVTFAAPATGPDASFGGKSTTTVTTDAAVATAPALTAGTVAGSYTVSASVSGVSAGATFSLTDTAAAPYEVVFGQQPTDAVEGEAIGPAVTVEVEDQYYNVVTTDSSTVTLTLLGGTFQGGSSTIIHLAASAPGVRHDHRHPSQQAGRRLRPPVRPAHGVEGLRRREIEVPTRGRRQDIGPGQSHRGQAVRLYLRGLEANAIARRLYSPRFSFWAR